MRLHVWRRGVYAVGHRVLGANGRRMAAQLAGGARSALCRQTAADFLGIKPYAGAAMHIWVPGQRGRKLSGVVPHRLADVAETDIEVVEGIRTTSAMRVLVDMAGQWTVDQIVRAFDRTEELRLFDLHALEDLMTRRPARPGSPNCGW